MTINLTRCVGCYACVIACKQAHFLPPDICFNRILITETGSYPTVLIKVYPIQCNHCSKAPCVEVCPTGATKQRPDGIVWVEQDKCAGCRYCITACPYQVRSFLSDDSREYFPGQGLTEVEKIGRRLNPYHKGVVLKCDFCKERIDYGIKMGLTPGTDREATPVCVNACPTKARLFGDLDNPYSEVSTNICEKRAVPFHMEFGTEPSTYYLLR